MQAIHILSPLLANQIAAGEVVARPASVVKELLENSIDAHADKIELQIDKGGVQRISITDNGCGIPKDELPLALARHATSKIQHIDDLMHITSLGFRGEALASISSVSRVVVRSKPKNQPAAWQILADFDQTEAVIKPCAHPDGTTIDVHELFFNTPARRKFLRSESTEFNHLEEVVRCIALSHFEVDFSLKHNNKLIWQSVAATTPSTQEQRLHALMGGAFVNNCLAIDIERQGLRLHGWLGLPTHSRSQKDQQYFYVNNRIVRDKIISHAISQAYQDVMYGHRYPVFVLYFSCDPEWVDVNVHPTKHEVRFRESRLVHDFIYYAIHKAIATIGQPTVYPESSHKISPEQPVPQALQNFQSEHQAFKYIPPQQASLQVREPIDADRIFHPTADNTAHVAETPPLGYAIGQLHGTFLLAQNAEGLVLIDIHAAHERIIYEEIKKNIDLKQFATQHLLFPLIIKLTPAEADSAEEYKIQFAEMGFELARLSHESIRVSSIPNAFTHFDIEILLRDILADLKTHGLSNRLTNVLMEKLGNIACKRAIKANHPLNIHEMNNLLRTMEQTPRYAQCNHGRPTVHYLSLAEVDKLFLRGR